MDYILVEYIDSKKYGKVAHFINEEGDIYSKVIEDDKNDTVYYQELTTEEVNELIENEKNS
jgi:hypothetical protein